MSTSHLDTLYSSEITTLLNDLNVAGHFENALSIPLPQRVTQLVNGMFYPDNEASTNAISIVANRAAAFCHEQLIDPREISDLAQMFSETAQKYPLRCEALKLIYNDEHQHNSFPGQSLPDKNRFLGRDEVAAVLLVAEQTQSMEIPAALLEQYRSDICLFADPSIIFAVNHLERYTNLNLTPGEYRDYYNIAIDVKDTAGPGGYEALDAFISTKSTGRESPSERLSRACADSARQVSSMELDIERSHQERGLGDAR